MWDFKQLLLLVLLLFCQNLFAQSDFERKSSVKENYDFLQTMEFLQNLNKMPLDQLESVAKNMVVDIKSV